MKVASDDVKACIANVEALKREIETRMHAVKEAKERLSAAQDELSAALDAGGTSGDWLRDQCLKMNGHEPALEAAYREVHDSLKGRRGEFIMLIYDRQKRLPGGIFSEERYHTATYYRLGVLTDDKLALTLHKGWDEEHHSYHLELPVTSFIVGEKEPFPLIGKLDTVQLSLFGPQYQDSDPPHFMKYVAEKSGLYPAWKNASAIMHDSTNAELVVGNAAVKDWLKKAAMQDLYKPAAHALGMLELEAIDAS